MILSTAGSKIKQRKDYSLKRAHHRVQIQILQYHMSKIRHHRQTLMNRTSSWFFDYLRSYMYPGQLCGQEAKLPSLKLRTEPGNPYWRGRLSTVDLLVLILILQTFLTFYKASYLRRPPLVTKPKQPLDYLLLVLALPIETQWLWL